MAELDACSSSVCRVSWSQPQGRRRPSCACSVSGLAAESVGPVLSYTLHGQPVAVRDSAAAGTALRAWRACAAVARPYSGNVWPITASPPVSSSAPQLISCSGCSLGTLRYPAEGRDCGSSTCSGMGPIGRCALCVRLNAAVVGRRRQAQLAIVRSLGAVLLWRQVSRRTQQKAKRIEALCCW